MELALEIIRVCPTLQCQERVAIRKTLKISRWAHKTKHAHVEASKREIYGLSAFWTDRSKGEFVMLA